MLLPALTGTLVWETINPVSMLHRGLIFGFGAAWSIVVAIVLFDVLVMKRGWCGHLCPMGAFYSLIGKLSLLRVATPKRSACDDCMDCYAVCRKWRGKGRRAADPVAKLHQLRPLHRCLYEGCIRIFQPVQ